MCITKKNKSDTDNSNAVNRDKSWKPHHADNKRKLIQINKIIKFVKFYKITLVIVFFAFAIIILLAILQCANNNNYNIKPQVEEQSEKFPLGIDVNKNVNSINVNSLLKDCVDGKQTYDNALNNAIKILFKKSNSMKLESFGSAKPESENFDKLSLALDNFVKITGVDIHMLMFDINTSSGFSYNADIACPFASSIKLPYIASILEQNPELYIYEKSIIENCLTWSDNESYFSLYASYGTDRLRSWCDQLGITDDVCIMEFPEEVTARDMALLWLKSFYFLHTYKYGNEICNMLENTNNSFFREIFGNKYIIHSKPGWWDGSATTVNGVYFNGLRADCGVIHDVNNPYILVIYCEDYCASEELKEIVDNIDTSHRSMFVKHIVISNQEELDAYNENNNANKPVNNSNL